MSGFFGCPEKTVAVDSPERQHDSAEHADEKEDGDKDGTSQACSDHDGSFAFLLIRAHE